MFQLAWIAERFRDWTGSHTPENTINLLTNVMLYWLTDTAASSSRIYREEAAPTAKTSAPAPSGVCCERPYPPCGLRCRWCGE